jgi:hypothetical protein
MKRKEIERLVYLEEKFTMCMDLLSIARDYCELNCYKSREISELKTIIEVIFDKQKELVNNLEKVLC